MSTSEPGDRIAVAAVQAELVRVQARWQAGGTFLTEMPAHQRQQYLGFTPPPGDSLQSMEARGVQMVRAFAAGIAAPQVPASFDWRNNAGRNFITSVKDQGSCGSCVAFGTTAAVEAAVRIKRADPTLSIDLSEASLFYCIGASRGRNCASGWWPADALAGYQATGVPDESCFAYTPGDQPCTQCTDWQTRATKITAYHALTDQASIKSWLSTGGPTPACLSVYDDFFSYTGGVYHHVTGNLAGGHCVCIVGYDDGAGCWICKNSWNATWGEAGFFRIAYGECGIEGMVNAVDGIAESPRPQGCLPGFLRPAQRR